ncbi:MAG: hypothetical protein IRZ00_15530 [Gemmatimonadetes bacterium]|nr:hypothetical protein [Gemmatimonadota bacterium]
MGFALGEDSLGGGFRPKAGSTLIAVRIPVERIMSFPRTGIGSWPEEKFVMMDGEHEARIIDVSGDYEMLTGMYRRDRRKIIEWFWNTEGAR